MIYAIVAFHLFTDDEINLREGLPSSRQKQQAAHTDTCNQHHQPLHYSTDIHHGSFDRYKEMVRKGHYPEVSRHWKLIKITA